MKIKFFFCAKHIIVVATNGKKAGKKAMVIKQLDDKILLAACFLRVLVESKARPPIQSGLSAKMQNSTSIINIRMNGIINKPIRR